MPENRKNYTKNQYEFLTLTHQFYKEVAISKRKGYVFPEGFRAPTKGKRISKKSLEAFKSDLNDINKFAYMRIYTDEKGVEHVYTRKSAMKSMAFEVPKDTHRYNAPQESLLMYESVLNFLDYSRGNTDFGQVVYDIMKTGLPQDGISTSDINVAITRLAARDIILVRDMLYENGKSDLEFFLNELINELPVSEDIKQKAHDRIPETFYGGEE